jgi:all-trans-retinol dehydrogenase (NAD+)
MKSVAGKNVLITGAAMGMGKLYAELAVQEKAAGVALWDIDQQALAATADALKAKGGAVHAAVVDVSKPDAIRQAAERVHSEVGAIQVLVNNAGIGVGGYFWEHTWEQIDKTMAINTLAPQYLTHTLLPGMMRSGEECRIVNMASAAGLVAVPKMSMYCASKWALVGWSDTLRLELAKAGHRQIKVTTVCPTFVATRMFRGARPPMLTRMLTPEQVVHRVWRKMKSGAPFVKMPVSVHISCVLKGLLPTRWSDFVAGKLFGVHGSLDELHPDARRGAPSGSGSVPKEWHHR